MAPSNKHVMLLISLIAIGALSLAVAQVPPPPPPSPPAVPPAAPSTGTNSSSCNPLKLQVCVNLLGELLGVRLPGAGGNGTSNQKCCPLLAGLVDLDAAVCLCTAIRANVFGIIILNLAPGGLNLLLNDCGKAVPSGFTCTPA
ncbi:hypothetical protein BS78_06G079100 [Paspalum vaginatum]|nr:hypothetical protein BS78_06G079100 [Paspalum vaginatum]